MTKPTRTDKARINAGCDGKQQYARDQAQAIVRSMLRLGHGKGQNLNAYRCASCKQWHIGTHLQKTVAPKRARFTDDQEGYSL